MKISIVPHVNEQIETDLTKQVVIVLDIFRATSFIVTALAFGAKRIIPVATIQEAKRLANQERILAGERRGQKIEGFDLSNSPSLLRDYPLADREIVLTTTNGTAAIQKAKQAGQLLLGSFLNLSACCRAAVQQDRSILILCSGTEGAFSLEDSVAAGGIIDTCLQMNPTYQLDDLGLMAQQSYRSWRRRGWNELKNSRTGRRVIALGLEEDLDYALQIDRFSIIPAMTKKGIEIIEID